VKIMQNNWFGPGRAIIEFPGVVVGESAAVVHVSPPVESSRLYTAVRVGRSSASFQEVHHGSGIASGHADER